MIIPKDSNPNHEYYKDQALDLISELNPAFAWEVIAKRYRKKRSIPQNSYFWGVIVKIIHDETGNDAQDIHDVLCGECFGWIECEVMGIQKNKPVRGTSTLSVEEFEAFCEWCRAFAATEIGIIVPLPNEPI